MVCGEECYLFSDVVINIVLVVVDLVENVIVSVEIVEIFGIDLCVVMLSFFIKGFVKFDEMEKVVEVIVFVKEKVFELMFDGEF